MNEYFLSVALNMLIIPSAIAGLLRFRTILPADKPFVVLLMIGSLNEILSFVLAQTVKNNIPCAVIYELFDAYFLTLAMFRWGCLYNRKILFWGIQVVLATIWIIEHHNKAGLFTAPSLFPVAYSCVLVFMAIDRINMFIVTERGNLLRNGRFLVTMGILVSSSFEAFQEVVFWIYPDSSPMFYDYLWDILQIVMIFVNVANFFGVLRFPKRERFVLAAN